MDSETRRINKNPNALKRGLACFTCRRRKMVRFIGDNLVSISSYIRNVMLVIVARLQEIGADKKASVKPACSPCIKSRQQCVYPEIGSDDKPDGNQGIKRKNKVKDLEDKIREYIYK